MRWPARTSTRLVILSTVALVTFVIFLMPSSRLEQTGARLLASRHTSPAAARDEKHNLASSGDNDPADPEEDYVPEPPEPLRVATPPYWEYIAKHARIWARRFSGSYAKCKGAGEQAKLPPPLSPLPREKRHYRLVAMVLSARGSFAQREAARATWLQAIRDDPSVMYRFVMGECEPGNGEDCTTIERQLREEQSRHGDLLKLPVSDDYFALSKKIYTLMAWVGRGGRSREAWEHVRRYAPEILSEPLGPAEASQIGGVDEPFSFDFYLKMDDDVLVRFDMLLWHLGKHDPSRNLHLGHMFVGTYVHPDATHKHGEVNFKDCGPLYHPYAAGAGYVLSRPVVHAIARYDGRLRFLRNEDATVGLWAISLSIERHHLQWIELEPAPCTPGLLMQHPMKPDQVRSCWPMLTQSIPTQRVCVDWES